MKNAIFSAVPLLASIASAAPLVARQNIDATVLNFALTLEHLENVFYQGALDKFSAEEFAAAGYDGQYYKNLQYIAHDEKEHVSLLTGALTAAGVKPVEQCTYSFPYEDVKSFITLSSVLEGVGTSAYLGGAPLITSKDYLAVAGSILVTEALHTSLQRVAIGEVAAANPYGTALAPTSVFTLAAAFIKECPADSPALPFKAFPSLSVVTKASKRDLLSIKLGQSGKWQPEHKPEHAPALPCGGDKVEFSAASNIAKGSYVTFVSGLTVVSVQGEVKDKTVTVEVPTTVEGQSYVFITSKAAENNKLDESAVVFGPAILEVAPQPL